MNLDQSDRGDSVETLGDPHQGGAGIGGATLKPWISSTVSLSLSTADRLVRGQVALGKGGGPTRGGFGFKSGGKCRFLPLLWRFYLSALCAPDATVWM